MARRLLTNPRKQASQERSRATVDALIEATARLLVREGFDRASTNRIAAEAGVSIGSLYQYYPSKEALVAAVIDRHNQELMQVVRVALAEVAVLPIEQAVRKLVAVAIDAHRIDPSSIASCPSRFHAPAGSRRWRPSIASTLPFSGNFSSVTGTSFEPSTWRWRRSCA
jgi:AcrR family transcriptional regulator